MINQNIERLENREIAMIKRTQGQIRKQLLCKTCTHKGCLIDHICLEDERAQNEENQRRG